MMHRAALNGRESPRSGNLSGVEPEVHHVAVLDDVFLAFQPQLAGIARAGLALEAT